MDELRRKIITAASFGKHAALYPCFEVSGASVYRIIQIANSSPYVAISASRKKLSTQENNQRHTALLQDIKEAGLYAYQMIGGYEETDENDSSKTHQVIESSFFVPFPHTNLTEFIELFQRLQKKYDQDAILVGLPNEYDYKNWKPILGLDVGGHYFITQDGKAEKVGTKATIKTFDKYGSIGIDPKKNRIIDWAIAGITTPNGSSGCFLLNRAGLKWFSEGTQINVANENQEKVQKALKKILKNQF